MINSSAPRRPQRWPSRPWQAALYYNRRRRKLAANTLVNEAPTAAAGPDQSVAIAAGADMAGSRTDDRLPSGILTNRWTKVSGPGTVTFNNDSSLTAHATFSATGSYVLRLTVSDGVLSAHDDVTITVT